MTYIPLENCPICSTVNKKEYLHDYPDPKTIAIWCRCKNSRKYGNYAETSEKWNHIQISKRESLKELPPVYTSNIVTRRDNFADALGKEISISFMTCQKVMAIYDKVHYISKEKVLRTFDLQTLHGLCQTRYNPIRNYFEWRYLGQNISWARNMLDSEGWVKCEKVDVNALYLKENPYVD